MSPLQIFEKHPEADAYRVGGFYSPYALVMTEKRFTEAELAAEYWANEVEAWRMVGYRPEFYNLGRAARLEYQADTFRKFATRPHFDA